MARTLPRFDLQQLDLRPGDVAVGGALFVLGLYEVLEVVDYPGTTGRLLLAMVLQTLPLVLLRSATWTVAILVMLGVTIEVVGQEPSGAVYSHLCFVALLYGISRWESATRRPRVLVPVLTGVLVYTLGISHHGLRAVVLNVVTAVVVGGAAWLVGSWSRQGSDHEQALSELRARAVAEERARISRDLHDVVGHALAGIAVTAGAVGPRAADPEVADALEHIRAISQDASGDVRRLVGLLRQDGDDHTSPQPTLADIRDLVDRAARSGVSVRYEEVGEPGRLSPGLQVAAYRTVQEGITNALRHAPDTEVVVRNSWHPRTLVTSVENARPGVAAPRGESSQLGLVGVRERVELYGGRLTAGQTGTGGFLLRAEFPL
ncbi:MAG: histidine kinase [Nocardioides sp.]|nr:histidine kinase [Nocardioides sp.]